MSAVPSRLVIATANINTYGRADRFDITRGTGTGDGLLFAPSHEILAPAIAARKQAEKHLRAGNERQAMVVENAAWRTYEPLYVEEMRASARAHRDVWDRLLARERVTLVCFCDLTKWPAGHCHRVVLAGLLVKFGATYEGEITQPTLF